ncbi:MAG: hypothetical protein KAJ20_02775, partial [Candidatus Aenigmarchaeota archaeon]|nr:hypothetical protein [Candidatus Aenigmarchaeota archaeon]
IRFNEADSVSREFLYDSGLTATTGKQIGYLEMCDFSDIDFVKEYYNALCVLDDCVNSDNVSERDSALRAYKKINLHVDSAIGSVRTGDFVPDSVILDYIKKISERKATVRLSEIAV